MTQLPEFLPDILPVVTWTDWIAARGRRSKAQELAEQRAKLRRVLWRAFTGRVDRAYNPRMLTE